MFNNTADLLKQIAIGEDSVLELKTIEFKGDQVAGPHRNSMADLKSQFLSIQQPVSMLMYFLNDLLRRSMVHFAGKRDFRTPL